MDKEPEFEGFEFLTELNGTRYHDFKLYYKRRVVEKEIKVAMIQPGTSDEIVEVIKKRINPRKYMK